MRRFDSWLRWSDFRSNRTVGGALTRAGVSRHTTAAVTLPALLVLLIVNGPALRLTPRFAVAIVAGLVSLLAFGFLLSLTARRSTKVGIDLAAQLTVLLLVAAGAWFVAGPIALERSGTLLYRHVVVPLVAIVAISLAASALLLALLFKWSERGVMPTRLTEVEMFELRTEGPTVTIPMLLVAVVGAVTSSPGRVLLPSSLLALLVERQWVWWTFLGVLVLNLFVLAFGNIDPRFNATWNVLHRLTFRAWSRIVSAFVIALGLGRFFDIQYVSTVFDGARSYTIVGYVLLAYTLAWWWDYWTGSLLATRFLDAFRSPQSRAEPNCIDYPIRGEVITTRVPESGRVIQTHGAGRILVLNDSGKVPFFHSYEPAAFADALIDGADQKARKEISLLRWRVSTHFLLSAAVLLALMFWSGMTLRRLPQQPLIAASVVSSGPFRPATLLFPPAACSDTGVVIAVAASGGGTRAAIYTASVLARLQSAGRLSNVRLVSGVSGGGAALAYFAEKQGALVASDPSAAGDSTAWETFFAAMQRPYIEDVIDGAGEWRMISSTRLGNLLAESFERHWGDSSTFGSVTGLGILLNSAIAGRYPGDGSMLPLAEQEASARERGRSDVAGGRVVYTNMDLAEHMANRDLFDGEAPTFTRDARLPVFVMKDPSIRIASAVAANANFPPVFSNAAIDRSPELRLWVTDGGAIDNRGVETMLMVLRDAIVGSDCQTLPTLHILEAEASALSDAYSQDRGLGSMMSAGTAFASQLDSELLEDVRSLYRVRGLDPLAKVKFHFIPMPRPLRRSGSFGTHWMMQEHITVCEDEECGTKLELKGIEVVAMLRHGAAPAASEGLSEKGRRLMELVSADTLSDYSKGWKRLLGCLESGAGCE